MSNTTTTSEELFNDILITAILILDTKGERVITRYYPNPNISMQPTIPSQEEQLKLEQSLTTAASRSSYHGEVDICAVEGYVGVFATHDDVRVFVVMTNDENETVGSMLLATVSQNLQYLFNFKVTKTNILNSVDLIMFLLDEVVDNGYIIELDVDAVMKRVSMRDEEENQNEARRFQQNDTSLTNAISRALGW